MAAIRLVLPMPPTLTNSGRGRSRSWRAMYYGKKAYYARLDEMQGAGLIPPPPVLPFKRPMLSSVMYLGGKMDMDNAMARHKWPLDWLATRGYVVNDRHIEWHTFPQQIVKRDDDYRLELTLRERI